MTTQDTTSAFLGLLLMGDGQHNSDWGAKTNANLLIIEAAIRSAAPVSEVKEFYGTALPSTDYLWANGQAVSRADYPALFAAVGTTYGVGNGTTTFNVPDRREVVAIGQSTMGGTAARGLLATARNTLGEAFGEELHALTVAELASHGHGVNDTGHTHGVADSSHTHSVADPGHAHGFVQSNSYNGSTSGSGGSCNVGVFGAVTGGSGTGVANFASGAGVSIYAASTGISIKSTGSGTAHNNMQPTIVCNFIIRAK